MLAYFLQLIDTLEDQEKFEQLYNQYQTFLISQAYEVTKNHATSEEVAHECLEYLIYNLDNVDLNEVGRTKKYLSIMAHNKAIDSIKKLKRELLTEKDDVCIADAESEQPANALQSKESYEALLQCLDTLPYPQREIFIMHFDEKMSFS